MTQSHYSLRWNNHQSHILAAFDALLQAETLVDVTLVCAETSVRAHKVVLSACSPFFQRIFSENPCKHPVIVLKDFSGWEVQAIVDFMYKGEISVVQEQLQSLIKAAESLQVRGLANQDPFGVDKESTSIINQTPTPSTSPNDYDRGYFNNNNNHHHNNHNNNHHHHHHHNNHNNNNHNAGRYPTPGVAIRTPGSERISPFSPQGNFEPPPPPPPVKLPHMPRLSFPETLLPRQECHSPIPRRKQARPRRRSGEMCAPQDLSTHSIKVEAVAPPPPPPPPPEETAENLCIKKPHREEKKEMVKKEDEKPRTPDMIMPCHAISPEMDLSMHGLGKDFRTSPVNMHPVLNLKQEIENHSPLPFPPMPSVSALAMTPPHIPEKEVQRGKIRTSGRPGNRRIPAYPTSWTFDPIRDVFGLEPPLGLFPPGLDGCRNPLFDLPDPRTTPDSHIFVKKKMGRPKGQHSAPRGGPPRSWTNAELTEALQHVWNKKMTTSQASRIFGIPYNSLLMYVRGKYGKSLKLEQLRKDCIGGPNPTPMDLLNLGGGNGGGGPNNNNNTPCKPERIEPVEQLQPNTRPPSAEEQHPHGPLFNPFTHNFYPDFGTGFPIPVSMIHLLPQSEKSKDHFGQQSMLEEECKERLKELEDEHDLFRPPMLSVEDRRELVQQNGQD